jgi:hypothetical protein
MQKQTLFIIGTLSVIILGSCTAFFSDINTTKTHTGVTIVPDHSGTETDTGKRLTTYTNSGTNWGMSPFGSGKPLETSTNTRVFKKPNTEWKARTITLKDGRTLTYEFGKGNPIGADPLSEKEMDSYKNCVFEPDKPILSCGPNSSAVTGYVTPDVEAELLNLVSNPHWENLIKNCRTDFERADITRLLPSDMTYAQVIGSGELDLGKWISINPETGRKSIEQHLWDMQGWFLRTYYVGETSNINPCIRTNGGDEIARLFDVIYEKHLRPF